jgi:hypothetical protein
VNRLPYREVWAADFEFWSGPGERPRPLCVVARELRSGRLVRQWLSDGVPPAAPPYGTGPDSLLVAYYASAELGCHLALGWPLPARVLDLFAEFRVATCGRPLPAGKGLLGALAYYGLDGLAAAEQEEMRQLALRGGPYTADERLALLDYCQSDVDALARLLPAMLPKIDLPRALLRSRYMIGAARMEWVGVPIDTDTLGDLREHWTAIKARLVGEVDRFYGVFVPSDKKGAGPALSFSETLWEAYLAKRHIPWPRHPSGRLCLDDDTFRELARVYPSDVGPVRELRHTLSQLRLNKLAVGSDGRSRCLLSAFASKTGRNQPSNAKFIFGPSTWLRSLIKPAPGRAIAYCDWSAQELGIAAVLSGDRAMQEAYTSGDPYLWLAKRVGAVRPEATKRTHGDIREQYKVVSLGVLYGLSSEGMARKLDTGPSYGRGLMRMHRMTFPQFWEWVARVEDEAALRGRLRTTFGWTFHVTPAVSSRTIRNFPVQGNGAEMLRLACCLATERGVEVCAPVHDALVVEGQADGIDDVVTLTERCMREASELVLPGFPLGTEAKVYRYPERYSDDRGERMWSLVTGLLPVVRQGRLAACQALG